MSIWYLTLHSRWNYKNKKGLVSKKVKEDQNIFEIPFYRKTINITDNLILKIKSKKWKEKNKTLINNITKKKKK